MIIVLFMMDERIHIPLVSKEKNILLAPLREGVTSTLVACNVDLFYMPKFLATLGPGDVLPTKVHQLLEEYIDMMPEELPPRLPPETIKIQ